ncbi:MAG TPA: histidine phosphatase family protein [Frankiaceae bacterium]|nr:histidine phosphatase family protein [Frankiaceae bacterium]
MSSSWPDALWLIRHGESAGNRARDDAEAHGHAVIEIAERDIDVPLSDLGRRQAASVGIWIGDMDPRQQPTSVLVSPYVRAEQTADIVLRQAGLDHLPRLIDERLREREFGILDGLTSRGIRERFPEEANRRARLGKFYHRPPGGESWADVIKRLRDIVHEIGRDFPGERVLVVAHQVVVLLFRYVLEQMSEREILDLDKAAEIANCSLTRFEFDVTERRLVLQAWNTKSPLVDEGEIVTSEPDAAAGPR